MELPARRLRAVPGCRSIPVLFNEDDYFDLEKPENNSTAAVGERAARGFFDFRLKGNAFVHGYQSVPAKWSLSSARKRNTFKLLAETTGASTTP